MNKRNIILDFTSLLDIIMIILFFFILFSHFESVNAQVQAKNEAQAEIEEAHAAKQDAEYQKGLYEEKLEEIESLKKQAEDILAEAQGAADRASENFKGISEFSEGKNLVLNLNTNDENKQNWKLVVYKENELVSTISVEAPITMTQQLKNVIAENGYVGDDTILCQFTFKSTVKGTYSVHKDITDMFERLKQDYPHLFYSEIDISYSDKDISEME